MSSERAANVLVLSEIPAHLALFWRIPDVFAACGSTEELDCAVFKSPPTQYRLYGRRSKDPTNSVKVLKEMLQGKIRQLKQQNTHMHAQ